MPQGNTPLGWGIVDTTGSEIWDAKPVFTGESVTKKDRLKLLFYPKKYVLYRWIERAARHARRRRTPFRILDVGCGTGATLIDLKKLFGRSVDVVGVDVVKLQVDIARQKLEQHGVWATVEWFNGHHLPFPDESFDVVYSSDVLGHVEHVPVWLDEMNRVLKPNGLLTMFSESKLGKHAVIRRYLYNRGLNVDPHAAYHISLYSKRTLKHLLEEAGFTVERMYTAFWASFFVHPDEFYEALQHQSQFPLLRFLNQQLYRLKKKLHPYSTAAAELYGLCEMMILGRFLEAQGYIIRARKRETTE